MVAVFGLAFAQSSRLEPKQEAGTFDIDPPTPYIHYSPPNQPRGCVLVVHGLDSSKETMQILSAALADGGFDVYNIDLPGHGDSPVGFDTAVAEQAVVGVLNRIGGDCVALGHSMGAAFLLDIAAGRRFPGLVLLSPPPLPLTEIQSERILLTTGAFDVPAIRAFAPVLADMAKDHLDWWDLKWAGHSTAIFSPEYLRRIVLWLHGSVQTTRTSSRLFWIAIMMLSGITFGVAWISGRAPEAEIISIPTTLARYVFACGAAILLLRLMNPVSWIRFFATDYVIGFVFVAGLALWIQAGRFPIVDSSAVIRAIVAAAFAIIVLGITAGSHLAHMHLSDGRWWRFPVVAVASIPFFMADEWFLRRIRPQWKSVAVAVITRTLLWAFLVTGTLLLNREDAFIVLIAHLIIAFWIGLWFATYLIFRHTQDPFAAALFAALTQAWVFSALFVTI